MQNNAYFSLCAGLFNGEHGSGDSNSEEKIFSDKIRISDCDLCGNRDLHARHRQRLAHLHPGSSHSDSTTRISYF